MSFDDEVPIPRSVAAKARAAYRVSNELSAQLGRHPSHAEIADALGISAQELRQLVEQATTFGAVLPEPLRG